MNKLSRFISLTRQDGIGHAIGRTRLAVEDAVIELSALCHDYLDRRFDRRFGVATGGFGDLSSMNVVGGDLSEAIPYTPTPISEMRFMMSYLPRKLDDFVFIDYGSGKGRAVLFAAQYRFKRVVGVEFAEELVAISKRNITAYRARVGGNAELKILHQDAATFPIPEHNCVFLFSNPFGHGVMEKVLRVIGDSFREKPRKMYFLYSEPEHAELFENIDFLHRRHSRRRWVLPLPPPLAALRVYETFPEQAVEP